MARPRPVVHALALAAVVVGVVAALAGRARAGDPDRVWMTIESEHFAIHYYQPLGDVAHRVAVVAERAHRTLSPILDHAPAQRTHVVLVDDTDGANGFASVLPRNQITLFITAPISGSVLADHDDWLYTLFAHEYTHILHLDTIGSLPALYNRFVGKTWSPNQTMPRWIIEGLATYEESKRSAAGRTRSSQFDMYLRVPVLNGEALRLDEVTNAPLRFPRGNTAYLYGSAFLKYVFDRFGDDAARRMSHANGNATVPFGVNRQIFEATGHDFDHLYDDWQAHQRNKASLQLEAVERRGRREGRRLSVLGEVARNPRYSRDGKLLYWLEADGVRETLIRSLPVGGDRRDARDVRRIDRVGTFDVDDSGALVYEQNQAWKDVYSYQDLFRWDPDGDRVERLTRGERARDPAVSPDGMRVVFSRNGPSRSEIVVIDRTRPDERLVVWHGDQRWDQAFAPSWSPDGKRVAFVAWRKGGVRDVLLAPADRENHGLSAGVVEVTHDRALDGDPVWSPDNKWLYFTSDRSGITNVYAWDEAAGQTWQVSNVVGGVTEMAVSPDGSRLAYGDFVGSGWDLYELALDPRQWTPALPFVDDRPDATSVPDDEVVVSAPRRYRALETLGPQQLKARLTLGSFGQAATVETSGADVAGLHGWFLGTTLELERGDLSVGGSYGYSGLRPGLRVSGARSVGHRTNFRINNEPQPWTEEIYSLTAGIGIPVRRTDEATAFSISFDYDFDWFRSLEIPSSIVNPDDLLPGVPRTDYVTAGAAMRFGFGNVRGSLYGVGPTEGMEASASVRIDHPAIGADYKAIQLSWFWRGYVHVPWGESTNMVLRLTGGMRSHDLFRGPAFALGGVPSQDVARAVIDSSRQSPTGYLRGYEPRVVFGSTFHLANVEYRQQLYSVEHGISTLPVYLKRLHVAALFDAGTAYDDGLGSAALKYSLGGAVRLDTFIGYFVGGTLELGYSHGLTSDGIGEGWLFLTSGI